MGTTTNHGASRCEFLHESGRLLAASALAMAAVPAVHAAENNTIQAGVDRLRRPRHGGGGQLPLRAKRPDEARRHGRRLRRPLGAQLRLLEQGLRRSRWTCRRIASSSASTPIGRRWTA